MGPKFGHREPRWKTTLELAFLAALYGVFTWGVILLRRDVLEWCGR